MTSLLTPYPTPALTIEVDPFEAIISLARRDPALIAQVGNRIDMWHHYGQEADSWSQSAKCLIFVPIGGTPDVELNVFEPQLEARCYGKSPYDCGQVFVALASFTKGHNAVRKTAVSGGVALVYFVLPLSEPRLLFDEDVRPSGGLPYFSVQLRARVAGELVE